MIRHDGVVQAAIIYESLTGNTRLASNYIAHELQAHGHSAVAMAADRVDLDVVQRADMVVLGTWVHGAFVVGAGPALFKLRNAPAMAAKPAVVFCTYALAAGKSLDKLTRAAESMGLTVLGGILIKRGHLQEGAEILVDRLLAGLPTGGMPVLVSR